MGIEKERERLCRITSGSSIKTSTHRDTFFSISYILRDVNNYKNSERNRIIL